MGSLTWTPDQDDVLRNLRAEGCSYGVIAIDLDKSRNACISRAKRLGVPLTVRAPTEPRRLPRPRKVKMQPQNINIAPDPLPELPASSTFLGIPLLELKANDCRFPRGEGPFLFCGQPKAEGSFYCGSCQRIVYRGFSER